MAQQPDGWQRNPDNTWTPPVRQVQHPPASQVQVPEQVQRSTIRDGSVQVRDAEDDLVVRMGKLSDGSYGLELLEGGLVIQQLTGTTITIRNSAGSDVITLGQDAEGEAALTVRDDSNNRIVILGQQDDGTYGLVVQDAAGNEVLRLGDLGSSLFGLAMKDTLANEVVRIGNLGSSLFGLAVSDTAANEVLRLGNLGSSLFGLSMKDDGGTEVIRIGDLGSSRYGLQMKNSGGTEVVRVGEQTDGSYDLVITEAGDDVKLSTLAFGIDAAVINTNEATTSTSYTDLATPGPAVTLDIGPTGKAIVTVTARIQTGQGIPVAGEAGYMGFEVSGASSVLPNDDRAFVVASPQADANAVRGSAAFLVTGLTPGSNTFTAKYRSLSGDDENFRGRVIIVEPF